MPGGCVYMSWLSEVADGVATVPGELPDQMHVDAAQRPTQAGMRHRVVEDEAGLDLPRSVARHSVFRDDVCDGLLRADLLRSRRLRTNRHRSVHAAAAPDKAETSAAQQQRRVLTSR